MPSIERARGAPTSDDDGGQVRGLDGRELALQRAAGRARGAHDAHVARVVRFLGCAVHNSVARVSSWRMERWIAPEKACLPIFVFVFEMVPVFAVVK